MIVNDIIKQEEELQATLKTIKDLTEEHNIFPLKGMIEQIDKLIDRSKLAIVFLHKWNNNSNLGETNGETNKSTA